MSLFKLILSVTLFTTHLSLYAQEIELTLQGTLVSGNKEALPGATIQLKNEADSTLVKITNSDLNGNFEFSKIKAANYILQINSVGLVMFKKLIVAKESINLGSIVLIEDVKLLKEVEVSGTKMLVESKPGMTLYHVASDPTAVGKSLADIASNLPGVSQSGTGALTYGGESQVTVLINGRKSNINPSDIVQQIQPANVERLELITGADPRFASSSGAATINIVLKKNKEAGIHGNTSFAFNNYGFINGSGNLNRFSGRTNLYVFASSDDRFLQMKTEYARRNIEADTLVFTGSNTNNIHHALGTLTAGLDFYIDSLNVITVEHSTSFHFDKMDAITSQKRQGAEIISTIKSAPDEWENTLSVNHEHRFKKLGKLIESEISGTLFSLSNFKTLGGQGNREQLLLDNYALRVRSEYTTPVAKKSTLNIGVDFAQIHTENKSQFFINENEPVSQSRFIYQNQKAAVYGSLILKPTKELSLRPGLRLERGRTVANGNNFENIEFNLTTFYPTLNILWEATKNHSVTIDFVRKIQYPNLFNLYTLPNQADTFNLQKGNTRLVPAVRHEGSFSHRYVSSKTSWTTRLYSHFINNAILSYTTSDQENRMSTFNENTGNLFGYGASLSVSFSPKKMWRVNGGSNFHFSEVTLDKNIYTFSTNLYSFSGFITNQVRFGKRATAEVNFRMMNFTRNLSERYQPMYNLSLQFNYKIRDDRWVISVLGNDILSTMINKGSILPTEFLSHDMTLTHRSQFIQATVRYKFGKTTQTRNKKLEGEKVQFSNG